MKETRQGDEAMSNEDNFPPLGAEGNKQVHCCCSKCFELNKSKCSCIILPEESDYFGVNDNLPTVVFRRNVEKISHSSKLASFNIGNILQQKQNNNFREFECMDDRDLMQYFDFMTSNPNAVPSSNIKNLNVLEQNNLSSFKLKHFCYTNETKNLQNQNGTIQVDGETHTLPSGAIGGGDNPIVNNNGDGEHYNLGLGGNPMLGVNEVNLATRNFINTCMDTLRQDLGAEINKINRVVRDVNHDLQAEKLRRKVEDERSDRMEQQLQAILDKLSSGTKSVDTPEVITPPPDQVTSLFAGLDQGDANYQPLPPTNSKVFSSTVGNQETHSGPPTQSILKSFNAAVQTGRPHDPNKTSRNAKNNFQNNSNVMQSTFSVGPGPGTSVKHNQIIGADPQLLSNSTMAANNTTGTAPQVEDWASLFFCQAPIGNQTTNTAVDTTSHLRKFSKKLIIAPYSIGGGRRLRDFLQEFEEAVDGGHPRSAYPVILADHLEGKAKILFRNLVNPGDSYDVVKKTFLHFIEKMEAKHEFPSVPTTIKYVAENGGAFGLICRIWASLRKFGDNPGNRNLALEAFWDRVQYVQQGQVLRKIKEKADSIALINRSDVTNLSHVIQAAFELQGSEDFVHEREQANIMAMNDQAVVYPAAPSHVAGYHNVANFNQSTPAPISNGNATGARPKNNNRA